MNTTELIQDAASEVMKSLGPDYTEDVYEEALMHEFRLRDIPYERQRNTEIIYKGYTVGDRRPDCILFPSWSGSKNKEFLLEMKAVAKMQDKYLKQAKVYLSSLNLDDGAVLNFNRKTAEPEIELVDKPNRTYKKEIKKPSKTKSKAKLKDLLLKSGKEVIKNLGTEFFYYDSSIYTNSVGVELRLKGINYHSATHPLLYKGHCVCDRDYDYIFPSGEAAVIFSYKKPDEIEEEAEELKTYNKLFKIKKGYVLALPETEDDKVVVKEV